MKYCILVTGIPASGKSTMARFLAERLSLPMFSKDHIKEILFDEVGFQSREEKVKLGIASMKIMYDTAEQMMKCGQPFVLENNFETISKDGLFALLERYSYQAITVRMTGDYEKIYERFIERNQSEERHRGHVVNDCYPEIAAGKMADPISFARFVDGIQSRGMDCFVGNGPELIVDTTDFQKIDCEAVLKAISEWCGSGDGC